MMNTQYDHFYIRYLLYLELGQVFIKVLGLC